MHNLTLSKLIDQLLETAIRDTASSEKLAQLHNELRQARARLQQPMRVAIVGLIKAGKSTAMNALLGEEVVATGTIETTFNINWLCFGKEKSLEVHFKDSRPPQTRTFEELSALTRRAKEHEQLLLSIKYIKAYFPNEMLHMLQLIDTPGLESVHGQDSQNTLDFIKVHGRELTEVTQAEARQADAVLYLFSQSISASVEKMIEEFQGPAMGSATPINSIGVLTRIDEYWPGERGNPLEAGSRIAKRLIQHPDAQHSLYTILPISGLLAFGAQTLEVSEFDTLKQLADLPLKILKRVVRDAESFTKAEFADIAISPAVRSALYYRLGQYGTWRACEHLCKDKTINKQELQHRLYEESGLPQLRQLILSHFGNRAFLIKLEGVLRQLLNITFRMRSSVSGQDLKIVEQVARIFEEIRAQQESLRELEVLRRYYDGKLDLSENEVQQLLQITGEFGTAYYQRLGITDEENIPTLERLQKAQAIAHQAIRHWQCKTQNPGLNAETRDAAQKIVRAYEGIAYHLQEALPHLDFSQ